MTDAHYGGKTEKYRDNKVGCSTVHHWKALHDISLTLNTVSKIKKQRKLFIVKGYRIGVGWGEGLCTVVEIST